MKLTKILKEIQIGKKIEPQDVIDLFHMKNDWEPGMEILKKYGWRAHYNEGGVNGFTNWLTSIGPKINPLYTELKKVIKLWPNS